MNTTYTMQDQIVAEEKKEKGNWRSRLGDILATTYVVLHFVPILTSIAWIVYFISGQSHDLMCVLAPVMMVGLVSAFLTHPIKIIWFAVKRIAYALWHPLVSVPVIPLNLIAAAVGGGLAATLYIGLIFFAPGALTLYYLFTE